MQLPDHLIIGRLKCGTTTLAKWLDEQPEIFFCPIKEARFFNREDRWSRGVKWYSTLFRRAGPDQCVGEGTPGYTNPRVASLVADRIHGIIPDVRLIYMLREPSERIRSDYRHRRIGGQEDRPFAEAVTIDSDYSYVSQTLYYTCLEPYIERFRREQILIVRMEDVVGESSAGWAAVLKHLGLPFRPPPQTAHNVSAEKGFYRGSLRVLRSLEMRQRLHGLPAPIRRVGKRLARTRTSGFDRMLEESRSPIPLGLLDPVWDDLSRLEAWMGATEPLWPRELPPSKRV